MKVVARRLQGFAHEIDIEGGHTIVVDEPADVGGTDTGPSPGRLLAASLASCTAVTMEMYAERKGWERRRGRGRRRRAPTTATSRPPSRSPCGCRPGSSEEQRERLLVVASKCPVHRALTGETTVTISDRVEVL